MHRPSSLIWGMGCFPLLLGKEVSDPNRKMNVPNIFEEIWSFWARKLPRGQEPWKSQKKEGREKPFPLSSHLLHRAFCCIFPTMFHKLIVHATVRSNPACLPVTEKIGRKTWTHIPFCLQPCCQNSIQTNTISSKSENSGSLTLPAAHQPHASPTALLSPTAVSKGTHKMATDTSEDELSSSNYNKKYVSQLFRNVWEERRGVKFCWESRTLVLPSFSFCTQLCDLSNVLCQLPHFYEHQSWKL